MDTSALDGKTLEELVQMVTDLRQAGNLDWQVVDEYVKQKFGPQKIYGIMGKEL